MSHSHSPTRSTPSNRNQSRKQTTGGVLRTIESKNLDPPTRSAPIGKRGRSVRGCTHADKENGPGGLEDQLTGWSAIFDLTELNTTFGGIECAECGGHWGTVRGLRGVCDCYSKKVVSTTVIDTIVRHALCNGGVAQVCQPEQICTGISLTSC